MQKKILVAIGICCACAVAGIAGVLFFSNPGPGVPGVRDTVTVGTMNDETSALLFIADDRGFFSKNGLNVTIRTYPNGAAAIRGMENGDVNLTLSSEFPLAAEIAGGRDIVIAGSVDKYYGTALVARKDRGILAPEDLAGKTIAISKNSVGEFYLGRFLDLHGIGDQNVTQIDRPPDMAIADISGNGTIDGIVTTPKNVYILESRAGNPYTIFPIQSGQATFKLVAGNRSWVTGNTRAVDRFFRGLRDAEEFSRADPPAARAIVTKRMDLDEGYVTRIWPGHSFSLSLDQSLILALEDETRWMIQHNRTLRKTVPDYLDNVYTASLERVDPDSVAIIRPGGRS